MTHKKPKKVTWSLKVNPGLKEWFENRASLRETDSQEDVRQILANFREKELNKDSEDKQ